MIQYLYKHDLDISISCLDEFQHFKEQNNNMMIDLCGSSYLYSCNGFDLNQSVGLKFNIN